MTEHKGQRAVRLKEAEVEVRVRVRVVLRGQQMQMARGVQRVAEV